MKTNLKNRFKILFGTFLLAGSVSATLPASGSPPVQMPDLNPTEITFDGFSLGTGFLDALLERTAYSHPCDIDPINDGARSVIFFTARPCKGVSFPENTTLVMFTSPSISEENPNAPLTTIAWMGGSYYNSRSTFPAQVGMTQTEVTQKLGAPLESYPIEKAGKTLTIQKHPHLAYSLMVAQRAVGFVLGEMPPLSLDSDSDERFEEWNALLAGYFRFTPEPPSQTPPTPSPDPTPSPTPTPSPQPGQPDVDPRARALIDGLLSALLIADNEDLRFNSLVPVLHRSLLTRDKRDFAPGIREYAYRRACREAMYFQLPSKIVRVRRGTTTAIGVGAEKEIGRVDRYYIEAKTEYQSTVSPAPLHVFFPQDGGAPSISNFGSL